MKVGDRYSSPWGEYTVYQTDPVHLRKGNACIVNPGADTLAALTLMGSGNLSVESEPPNGSETVPTPHASAAGLPAQSRAEIVVDGVTFPLVDDALDHAHQFTLGAYRSFMSMAWSPSSESLAVWTPCRTRSKVEGYELQPHLYFIGKVGGSIACPQCRLQLAQILWLEGDVVVWDSHEEARSEVSVAAFWNGFRAATTDGESSSSELSSPVSDPALCPGESDEELASSDLSPTTAPNCVGPSARDVVGAVAELSAPALLAMTVASEETLPTEVPPASAAPSLFPPDDPKETHPPLRPRHFSRPTIRRRPSAASTT